MSSIANLGFFLLGIGIGVVAGCQFKEWFDRKLNEAKLNYKLSVLMQRRPR